MARRVHGAGAACRQLAAAGTLSTLPIVSTPRLRGTRHQDRDLLEFLNFETDNMVSIDAQHFFIKCSFGGFHIFSIYEEDTTRYKGTFELVVST